MASHDGTWRCPVCLVEAKVEGRKITVTIQGPRHWPRHFDCELGKDIDSIKWRKLERVP